MRFMRALLAGAAISIAATPILASAEEEHDGYGWENREAYAREWRERQEERREERREEQRERQHWRRAYSYPSIYSEYGGNNRYGNYSYAIPYYGFPGGYYVYSQPVYRPRYDDDDD